MIRYNQTRSAIAMIELIFSIVVIGIVLMSAPILMQQASKGGYVTMQQEGINEASSRISMIMEYDWDENDRVFNTILRTSSLDTDLNGTINVDGIIVKRIGTPNESSKRKFIDINNNESSATPWNSLGTDVSDAREDDIDDFAGTTYLIEIETSSADTIEKTTIDIDTDIAYISDSPSTGAYNSNALSFNPNFTQTLNTESNIKRITTTLTSSSGVEELNKTIILHAFKCNIGAPELELRPN